MLPHKHGCPNELTPIPVAPPTATSPPVPPINAEEPAPASAAALITTLPIIPSYPG